MMRKYVAVVGAGFLLASALCGAQMPPGVTMEMVNTTLPEEGAPKAVPGPHATVAEGAFGQAGLKIFRPAKLDGFSRRGLPVVVWGNGGCALENTRAAGFLQTIASHGFLVVTTTAGPVAEGAPRRVATAADLAAGITWAETENQRAESALKGRINLKQVAVMGQSCGGRLSLELGADPRVTTIGVFNAGLQSEQMGLVAKLHGPVLLINGGERDFMMGPAKATFDAIDRLPVFYGSRHGAGHTATLYHVGGGEFANVASNWLRWQFNRDQKAAQMFVGKNCGLCTNADWDAEAKRLKAR
jgi:dienelactone hydrolase